MKFQNISVHGSKVMLYTRKRDEQTNEQTDKPEAICPPTFFKVGGHRNSHSDIHLEPWTLNVKLLKILSYPTFV